MRSCCLFRFASLLAFAVLQFPDAIHAQEPCESPAGRFTSIEGSVDVQSGEAQGWHAAKLDERLCEGDTIRVGERSRAAVYMVNEAVLRIDQNTTMRLLDVSEKKEERTVLVPAAHGQYTLPQRHDRGHGVRGPRGGRSRIPLGVGGEGAGIERPGESQGRPRRVGHRRSRQGAATAHRGPSTGCRAVGFVLPAGPLSSP
jgi:hypothetical protein